MNAHTTSTEERRSASAGAVEARIPSPATSGEALEQTEFRARSSSCQDSGCLRLGTYRLDPRDQAHLDAAAREPAQAAALRRHFDAQFASTCALSLCRQEAAAGESANSAPFAEQFDAAADRPIPPPRTSAASEA